MTDDPSENTLPVQKIGIVTVMWPSRSRPAGRPWRDSETCQWSKSLCDSKMVKNLNRFSRLQLLLLKYKRIRLESLVLSPDSAKCCAWTHMNECKGWSSVFIWWRSTSSFMSEDLLLQFVHDSEGAAEHPKPLFSSISFRSQKDDVLISLKTGDMVVVGLGALRERENEFNDK